MDPRGTSAPGPLGTRKDRPPPPPTRGPQGQATAAATSLQTSVSVLPTEKPWPRNWDPTVWRGRLRSLSAERAGLGLVPQLVTRNSHAGSVCMHRAPPEQNGAQAEPHMHRPHAATPATTQRPEPGGKLLGHLLGPRARWQGFTRSPWAHVP